MVDEAAKEQRAHMKYVSDFSFGAHDEDKQIAHGNDIPVHSFMVDGGASRIITIDSTDNISIVSELEQARSFRGITLFLSPNKNGSDMRAALDLNNLHLSGESLVLDLFVGRLVNGQFVETFYFLDAYSKLKLMPYVVNGNLLTLHLNLTDPKIHVGRRQGEAWSVTQF